MEIIANAFGVTANDTTVLGAVMVRWFGCANHWPNPANDSRLISVSGSKSDLIGSSAEDLQRRLSRVSMAVVTTQLDDGSELWHYFPSESKVASCTRHVAVRSNSSQAVRMGYF